MFRHEGVLYRQINAGYQHGYDHLLHSGLYKALAEAGLLVEHQEVTCIPSPDLALAWKIIQPVPVDYISYPYEWCFSQLKAAALATLAIQRLALEHGMTLKDASAFNIQFVNGMPLFIDTLSFDVYQEGQPWSAYRQFCQHFLAPLALMAYRDVRLGAFSREHLDGIPLDLACKLLPLNARLRSGLLMHLFLHSRKQSQYAGQGVNPKTVRISRFALQGIIDSLEGVVQGLSWKPGGTEWADYYAATNYTSDAQAEKMRIVDEFLQKAEPKHVWDLGANTGVYSRLASAKGIPTVAFDIDPSAVEMNFLDTRKNGDKNMLPLVLNLTNPSPSLGWAHEERDSWLARGPVDLAMALALVHHLAIANNVPLAWIASLLQRTCRWLIIEFVPKEDSQAQRLLASRPDIFPDYNEASFKNEFSRNFEIVVSVPVRDSARTLFLMKNRTRQQGAGRRSEVRDHEKGPAGD